MAVLCGLRNDAPQTRDDVVRNNTLGEVYNYFLDNYPEYLDMHTIRQRYWVKDKLPEEGTKESENG